MEAFIESVRAQPCLWNPLHPDYREMHVKDEAWQCVVDQNNDRSIPNSGSKFHINKVGSFLKKYNARSKSCYSWGNNVFRVLITDLPVAIAKFEPEVPSIRKKVKLWENAHHAQVVMKPESYLFIYVSKLHQNQYIPILMRAFLNGYCTLQLFIPVPDYQVLVHEERIDMHEVVPPFSPIFELDFLRCEGLKVTYFQVQIAKSEWKKLRDNHRDALKRAKLGKNKLLPAQITTWKYAKHMQFLEPHMKYRITEHIEMEPINDSGSKRQREASAVAVGAEAGLPGPSAKRRAPDTDAAASARQDPDALESFFNCVLKSTREMPPWMQTQVKKNIFAVIIDAEERLSSRENDSPDQSCEDLQIENKIKCEVITDDY